MSSFDDQKNNHSSELPLIIALGNRYRGDDSAGLYVAEKIGSGELACQIVANQNDPMALINAWQQFKLVIIVDAAHSDSEPGTIHEVDASEGSVPRGVARCSSHGVGLAEAVAIGKIMDLLPKHLLIFAIEVSQLEPGASMSPAVRAAADEVVHRIECHIAKIQQRKSAGEYHARGVVDA